jgi:phage terminase large subunit
MKEARAEQNRLRALSAYSELNAPPEIPEGQSLVLLEGHPYWDLMHKKASYKVYWGGRGAAKSWAIAEALIRMAAKKSLRILCLREFQVSIQDSSHQLLKDTITRLGLTSWFDITDHKITSRAGSVFRFKGMHGQDSGIRSTEGVDIVWVEEAQSFSAASWHALIPTIRKDDSEIWISYNLMEENDATHKIFVTQGRPNSIVHHINYDQNPYMSQKLRDEMEADRKSVV